MSMPTSPSASAPSATRIALVQADAAVISLRRVLAFDAATCLAMGVVLIAVAEPIAGLTVLPAALLLYAGAALIPIAAFMALLALRRQISVAGTLLIVAGNLVWVAASIGIVLTGFVAPNPLGLALVICQALAVAVLAGLEYRTLHLARPGMP